MSAARPNRPPRRTRARSITSLTYLRIRLGRLTRSSSRCAAREASRGSLTCGASSSSCRRRNITRSTRSALRACSKRGPTRQAYGSRAMARGRSRTSARNAAPSRTSATRSAASRQATTIRPDVAIEVVWTSGGIDKLDVYRKLGVREVWFYERGGLRFFALRVDSYVETPRSELLPQLPVELLLECMREPGPGKRRAVRLGTVSWSASRDACRLRQNSSGRAIRGCQRPAASVRHRVDDVVDPEPVRERRHRLGVIGVVRVLPRVAEVQVEVDRPP